MWLDGHLPGVHKDKMDGEPDHQFTPGVSGGGGGEPGRTGDVPTAFLLQRKSSQDESLPSQSPERVAKVPYR